MLEINEYFYKQHGQNGFTHRNHSHNEIEFIQCVNGNGTVVKNDRTYLLQSQYIYVIDARNAHIVYPKPEDCSEYTRNKLVIGADSFMAFCKDLGLEEIMNNLFYSEPISTAEMPRIDELYKIIVDLCSSELPSDRGLAHGYLLELIHLISSHAKSDTDDTKKDTLSRMLALIAEHDGIISLTALSELLHMSRHYLCHLFREKTGITLSDYLANKVYEKSQRLLTGTAYSIEKVALLCGFSSAAAFSRFFKKKSGASPLSFRKNPR